MVTKCVVPNCGNSCNAKLSVTLFSFPKDSKMAQKWIQATRAQYLREIKSHHKVCSEHFEKHCILHHFGATRLAPGAIPTLFEWNSGYARECVTHVSNTSSFLAIQSVCSLSSAQTNNEAILPKTTLTAVPKVRIPPLVRRIPLPVSKRAKFNLMKSQPLMCDVVVPSRQKALYHQSSGSEILYQTPISISAEPIQLDSDDDNNGSEYIIGSIGNYTLSTKKVYGEEVEEDVDDPHPKNAGSKDGSDFPCSAKECSQDSGTSLKDIVESVIVKSLQDNVADHLQGVNDIPKDDSGEIFIEECSVIEEEIIPPEKASSPLSLAAYLEETNLSLKSKHIHEDAAKNVVDETMPEKSSNCETCPQASTKKRCLGSNKNGLSVKDNKMKLRKLEPVLQRIKAKSARNWPVTNVSASHLSAPTTAITAMPVSNVSGSQAVTTYLLQQNNPGVLTDPRIKINQLYPAVNGVVSPVVLQVGSMMLPVTSSVVKPVHVAVQNSATNSVNLVTPQMTYLIPFSGIIPPPLAIKASNSADIGSGQNMLISPETPTENKLPTLRKIHQKKRLSRKSGNRKPLNRKNCADSICQGVNSDSPEDRNKCERFSLKMKEMMVALKKKDFLVKKLKRDKANLTKKLKAIRRAFFKLRKATMLDLPSKYLEVS